MAVTHHVETGSGAHYEFNEDFTQVRRIVEPDVTPSKRADGEWVRVFSLFRPTEGKSMTLVLESLSHLGPDDHGNQEGGPTTTRHTTPVTRVWVEVGE